MQREEPRSTVVVKSTGVVGIANRPWENMSSRRQGVGGVRAGHVPVNNVRRVANPFKASVDFGKERAKSGSNYDVLVQLIRWDGARHDQGSTVLSTKRRWENKWGFRQARILRPWRIISIAAVQGWTAGDIIIMDTASPPPHW